MIYKVHLKMSRINRMIYKVQLKISITLGRLLSNNQKKYVRIINKIY